MTDKKRKENPGEINTDIVVIGAGGCGLAAAVAAAENGAKVIVLESRSKAGGATMFAEGPFAADSPVQKRLNIKCTSEDLFKMHMSYNHWTINARLVRAVLDISGDTIRWLEGMGVNFYMPHMSPVEIYHEWHNPRKGGPEVIEAFLNFCQSKGVQIHYETRATKILTDKSGAVSGVLAIAKEKPLDIKAKSVIIATGGFGGNKRMLQKYFPELDLSYQQHHMLQRIHKGDGIRMAFEIGAASDGLGNVGIHGPGTEARRVFGLAIEAKTVWLNRDGQRFMEESASFSPFESANGVMRQPGQMCFSVFDEALVQHVIKNGTDRPFESSLHSRPQDIKKMDVILREEARQGRMIMSDSWDEIAKWMGITPKTLKATITEYNADCDKKRDHIFAKDPIHLMPLRTPPYYAVRCTVGLLSTLGGIRINERAEVLDKEHKPIKGLYAGGNDAGGFCGKTYNVKLAGTGCGFAFNSGRIAGANASKYLLTY
jgi:fumarate reductase flavoprotein subunit